MLLSIAFFIVVSSGSVFGASVLKRKYEEMLPISIFSIILLQYFFGIAGYLRLGAYFVYIIAILAYLWSFASVIKNRSHYTFLRHLLTPGFVGTLVLYIVINVANYDMLAYEWMDFSHWADVVKAMVSLDDLATNPMSMSLFKSYVPAIPLFQYNLQILGQTLLPKFEFTEWYLYVSYQFATYSLLIFFIRNIDWKRIVYILLFGIVMFFLPSALFSFYDILYVDPFLSVFAGCSLALLVTMREDDSIDFICLIFSLSCLVLTKDTGFFIAIFIGLLYLFKQLLLFVKIRHVKSIFKHYFFVIASIVMPKLTWSHLLTTKSVHAIFDTPVDLIQFVNVLFQGEKTDYRLITAQNYWKALTVSKVQIGNTNFELSYLLLIIALVAGIIFLLTVFRNSNNVKWIITLQIGVALFSVAYVLAMCAMYMFKFSEYEAVRLASFPRYMSVLLMMLYTTIWVLFAQFIAKTKNNGVKYIAFFVLLLLLPYYPAKNYLWGGYVSAAKTVRAPYTTVVNSSKAMIKEKEAKVYIISQEDSGFDYWVLKYSMRPFSVNDNFTWSIGNPFFEGDVWSINLDVDEWAKQLIADYDYVLLYKGNDYFREEYRQLFNKPDSITDYTLYKVDKDSGMLYLPNYIP